MSLIIKNTITLPESLATLPGYTFPVKTGQSSDIHIKRSDTLTSTAADSSLFSFCFATTNGIGEYIKGAYLAVNTTNKTTIVETTGSGTLTHVLSPSVANGGDYISVWVTVDGKETEWYYRLSTNRRIILGGFQGIPQAPITLAGVNDQGGIGSSADGGYNNVILLVNPYQAKYMNIGIPFATSLKVEVQMHTTANNTTIENNAGVTYVLN